MCLLCIMLPAALGEGFRNPPAGAFALGRSGGRFAQVDDVSAATHNPANLAELSTPAFEIAPTLVYIQADHQNASGQSARTTDPWKILPNFFAATPLVPERLVLGLALTTPYGLSNEWEKRDAFDAGGALRYQAPFFTELKSIQANPSLALRLGESWRLGIGLDALWSELTFQQYYPWIAFPGGVGTDPEGEAKAQGDGVGVGANLAVTWIPHPDHRIALTYRSPIDTRYDGRFEVSNLPARAAFFGASGSSAFESRIEFPAIFGAGYGYQLSEKARIEANLEWIQFSAFDRLPIEIGNNNLLLPATQLPQDWKDTFTAGIGGDWAFARNWSWRASYQFYQSPVPNSTFTTTIPDANQNVFTTGLAWTRDRHHLAAAYGGIFYDDRSIQRGSAFDGDYQITVHLVSVSYRLTF